MSSAKAEKQTKLKQQEDLTKAEKKPKHKKKKKDSTHQSSKSKELKQFFGKEPKTDHEQQIAVKQQSVSRPAPDPIEQELSSLRHDGLLSCNVRVCKFIDSQLEQVTINLYECMIMQSSMIWKAIRMARESGLTPKDYFGLDYTNKLLLIRELLERAGRNKFGEFMMKIDEEVRRVSEMVVRSLEVEAYSQVVLDLKRCNVEWVFREEGIHHEHEAKQVRI